MEKSEPVSGGLPNPTAANEDAELLEEQPLNIGTNYLVKLPDGSWQPATLIKLKKNAESYYVHYEGYDHSLDQWVSRDRIMCDRIDLSDRPWTSDKSISTKDCQITDESGRKITCNQKHDEINHVQNTSEEMDPTTANIVRENITQTKYIAHIQLGCFIIEPWFDSPYPKCKKGSKLWVCEYCLNFWRAEKPYLRHLGECSERQPPGDEIYRSGTLSFYEVDGKDHKVYCQNLCLLAMLFLEEKVVYEELESFLFYILCEIDRNGAHILGYFSKAKESENNVACILTLPPYQHQGLGQFLIAFSYTLSRLEQVVGTPEKPLSAFGKLSYHSYWSRILLEHLSDKRGILSIKELTHLTGISPMDIVGTLQSMNMISLIKGKYDICVTPELVSEHLASSHFKKPRFRIDPSALRWGPKANSFSSKAKK